MRVRKDNALKECSGGHLEPGNVPSAHGIDTLSKYKPVCLALYE